MRREVGKQRDGSGETRALLSEPLSRGSEWDEKCQVFSFYRAG